MSIGFDGKGQKMIRYVLVGCGSRGINAYAKPIVKSFGESAALVGVCDINSKRAEAVSEICGKEIPAFSDFDEMLEKTKPDVVIVTTIDATHHIYAIRAMENGCDVIIEKPLATTPEAALSIRDTAERTGRNARVTFNLRFSPVLLKIKQLVATGIIGEIHSVHFQWMLDTVHGADYFRRWHRERKNSGSLLVHKSTHHFDLVNWFIDDEPEAVNAFGTRRSYGKGRVEHGERCLDCAYKASCKYYYDIEKSAKRLYRDCEDVDGYYRDSCIFSENIDIEDNLSVSVRYKRGAIMSYTLTAHSPYEGFNLVLNGALGRLEFTKYAVHGEDFSELARKEEIRVFKHSGEMLEIELPESEGTGHGGTDGKLLDNLINGYTDDPYSQMAGIRAGMSSIGIGMAANISMNKNRQVTIRELYNNKF